MGPLLTKFCQMSLVSLAFTLIFLVTACKPSKPSAADYVGVWTGGASKGCECMLNVATYGSRFMVQNENACGVCSAFDGVYALTADGNLVGGSSGVVTLAYDRKTNVVMTRSGAVTQSMRKLSPQALIRWRFAQQLMVQYGFKMDDKVTERCSVKGETGRCELAPFPIGNVGSRSCDMFATATYAGDCIDGMLSGLCLIRGVDRVAERDVAMGYFAGGRVLYPIFVANTSDETHPFGLQGPDRMFYCHENFSAVNDRYGCMSFRSLFDDDIFSRGTHTSLRNGTFNLAKYRASLEQRIAK